MKKEKFLDKRIKIIFYFSLVVGLVFVGRLASLQILGGEEYKKLAQEQKMAFQTIKAKRGSILDKNGNPLALSLKLNKLYAFPSEIKNPTALAKDLSSILGIREEEILEKIEGKEKIVLVKEKINNEELNQLKEKKFVGIKVESEDSRFYPNGSTMSHLIGFIDHEGNGSYGIEQSCDELLKGKAGTKEGRVTPFGLSLPHESQKESKAEDGKDIVLTVDERIQEIVVKNIEKVVTKYKPKSVSVIVMNPNNGDILALANSPKYDSNNPRQARSEEEKEAWSKLSEDKLLEEYYEVWRSNAVNDVYEPGSVFKFITAAAAYEEGTSTDSSIYRCDGVVTDIPGVTLKCWRWFEPHGDQTFVEAMDNSCNPAFIQIARDLGKEKFYDYIKKFGFGKKTNIPLPAESEGIIPESLDAINLPLLATLSYGHGIAVTPIQMIRAISAVVNGGVMVEPRLVEKIVDPVTKEEELVEVKKLDRVISEETSKHMRYMMKHGVDFGTADGAKLEGYDIGGKTGTSVKFIDGEYTAETTVASFLGIYPSEKPEFIVLAVVDEAQGETSGNVVSAPMVRDIIKSIADMKGEGNKSQDREKTKGDSYLPDFKGLSLESAVALLKKYDLNYSIAKTELDASYTVTSQEPAAGVKINGGEKVILSLEKTMSPDKVMPDLIGRSLNDSKVILEAMGVNYKTSGEGNIVVNQSVSSSQLLYDEPVLTLDYGIANQDKEIHEQESRLEATEEASEETETEIDSENNN